MTASVRRLYFGDNLEIMRSHIADESVDLVYLDPPFNSDQTYNVLFKGDDSRPSQAQIEAFDDTWHWTPETQSEYEKLVTGSNTPREVAKAIDAFRLLLGENDVMAYLVMMTPRLLEIHRVLNATGSMYLHCDPTASHYLKVISDQVFGPEHFQNEIVWCYEVGGRGKTRWARKHDVILFYSKTKNFKFHWDRVSFPRKPGSHMKSGVDDDEREYQEKTDSKTRKVYRYYLDEGAIPTDWWVGPQQLNRDDAERLGYPTQKPQELLERIINASSDPGDLVLDPFCGCGTTIAAAEKLGRSWIGIDISYLAIALIEQRLTDQYPGIKFEEHGSPRDMAGAKALFEGSHKNFEMWAVRMVGGRPNPKGGGDKGTDGEMRFYITDTSGGWITISVKGGAKVFPNDVDALIGTVTKDKTQMGILVTRAKPSAQMLATAAQAGTYEWPLNGQKFPKIQIFTVEELIAGKRPDTPPEHGTFLQAPRALRDKDTGQQLTLD